MPNRLFVISGPSGVGKTSLCNALLDSEPRLSMSVSCTTRDRREGEKDGESYHFLGKEEFRQKIDEDAFVEYAEVYGNYYGTLRSTVDELWSEGQNVLFNVDTQGVAQLKSLYRDQMSSVLIVPPDMETLEKRLRNRGTDSDETVETRLQEARRELAKYDLFDFVVENDGFERAVSTLERVYVASCHTPSAKRKQLQQLLGS